MKPLEELLLATAALHHHLCPRQVLGVRMGMLAGEVLGVDLPQADKRLLTIAETDGCAVDGISVASGCWVGRRTLRIVDFGKVAATFVDTRTERTVRIVPRLTCRERARVYAPHARNRWEAQLKGYQRMPSAELLRVEEVRLTASLEAVVSHPGRRATCQICGEEILNDRQIVHEGSTLCRACAGERYYSVKQAVELAAVVSG
ncbi:MAG: FmdE family protein [Actinobacteria bacterium]|nr:FmdE family protein [Actinomycetota bacterium]